jgi:hypothetical protein
MAYDENEDVSDDNGTAGGAPNVAGVPPVALSARVK